MHTIVNILFLRKLPKREKLWLAPHLITARQSVRGDCACALSDPLPVPSFWRVLGFSSALSSAWLRALTRMIIARSHAP